MRIPFTKMQGAGNDFVVLDETRASYHLRPEHYRFLGDRRYGVGADQILTVRPATQPGVDFASKPESFRVYARQVAASRGVKVSIKTIGGTLFLQALKPKPDLSALPFEMEEF